MHEYLQQSVLAVLCTIALLSGCTKPPVSPKPSPVALSQSDTLIDQARVATEGGDHESAALALREAVELLARENPQSQDLVATRALCTEAMVKAGGNTESFRLWRTLVSEDPSNVDAKRMEARARSLMLQQADELLDQAKADFRSGKAQTALCTARASEILMTEAGGPDESRARVSKFLKDLDNKKEAL